MSEYRDFILQVAGDKWVEPLYTAASICPFDLFFLVKYAQHLDAKHITEFGCGATTLELRSRGFNLNTFALDICIPIKRQKLKVDFVKCNLKDPKRLPEILESAKQSDLLIIDSCHSYEMAEYYHKNIFTEIDIPIWIHDFVSRPMPRRTGEQQYLDKHVVGKTHKIVTKTALGADDLRVISQTLGVDLNQQKARMVSVILERL